MFSLEICPSIQMHFVSAACSYRHEAFWVQAPTIATLIMSIPSDQANIESSSWMDRTQIRAVTVERFPAFIIIIIIIIISDGPTERFII